MYQEFSRFCYLHGFVASTCPNLNSLLAVMGVMHEADDAAPGKFVTGDPDLKR